MSERAIFAVWAPGVTRAMQHVIKTGELRGRRVFEVIDTDEGLLQLSELRQRRGLDGEDEIALDTVLTDRIVASRLDRITRPQP